MPLFETILFLLLGIFIGSTITVSVALYIETIGDNIAEREMAKDYVYEFGGTIKEAKQIIRNRKK